MKQQKAGRSRTGGWALLALLACASVAQADNFKSGVADITELAARLATNTVVTAQASAEKPALETLLEEIKADDFATDKAREVALNKAKDALKALNGRLPSDCRDVPAMLTTLVEDMDASEQAYAFLLEKENADVFARNPSAMLDWLYGTVAGIQKGYDGTWEDFELAPVPDSRLVFVEAEKRISGGVIKSAWKYERGKCTWKFTIPPGTKATVCVNGMCQRYDAGDHQIEIK